MMLTEVGHEVAVEQVGDDCFVTICGDDRLIKNCNALKLANTLFNIPDVPKYTHNEMFDYGFNLKRH